MIVPNWILNQCILIAPIILILILQIIEISAHECYVCKEQDNNREKCVKTVRTCDIAETSCMTMVRWGSTPYWDPTGQKQYYVSKECATRDHCERSRTNSSRRCDRIWYNDWECVDCCYGDRCNYFVTLGTNSIKPGIVMILLATIVCYIFHS